MSKSSNGRAGKSLADFEVDVSKEDAGEWFALDGPCQGVEVRLRSPFCEDFQRLQGSLQQQRKVFTATGDADVVKMDHVQRESIASCLLIDWRGISEPWSAELAKSVMTEQKYHKLYTRISALVRKLGNDEEVSRAAEGKGFAPPSDTVST